MGESGGNSMQRSPDRILDEYLVLSAQAGSRQALAELVRRWTPRLIRHAGRLLSDDNVQDVVQETWVSVLRGLGRIGDPARFPGWVYAIATRKCADALRGKYRRRRLSERAAIDVAAGNEAPAHPGLDDKLDVAGALARLPNDQRVVVDMFYAADLSVEEIAAALDTPAGTIKSRLFNARQALKQAMERTTS